MIDRATEYNKNNTVGFTLRCHKEKDEDIIYQMEQIYNKNQFLKDLIRTYINEVHLNDD